MTKVQALKKAQNLWGKSAMVRLDEGAFTAADREAAREVLAKNRAEKDSVSADEVKKATGVLCRYRCTIGYVIQLGIALFHVKGQGDTWEEAFEQAERHP